MCRLAYNGDVAADESSFTASAHYLGGFAFQGFCRALGFANDGQTPMNAGFGAVAAARFFCLLFAFCIAGDLTLKGQAVLREPNSVSPFSFEAAGEASYVGIGEAKRGSRSVGGITEISSFAGVVVPTQVAPRPQLRYLLSDNVTLFAGADLRETTFRMAENFGQSSGIRKLGSIGITAKF